MISKLTIIHTNDTHSRVRGNEEEIGFAKLQTLVSVLRALNPNTLLLDAGDTVHGMPISTLFEGESIIELMNHLGYDAMTAGNHDFGYGWRQLQRLNEQANFPILAGNITSMGQPILGSVHRFEFDGIKGAIIGVTATETMIKAHPKNIEGLHFCDPAIEVGKLVAKLRPEVGIIIVLSHLGTEHASIHTSGRLISEVPGIDLLIDGHSHDLYANGVQVNQTLKVSAFEYLKHIGMVELLVEKGKVVSAMARTISAEDASIIPPDGEVEKLIATYEKRAEEKMNQVIGHTSVTLHGERHQVRTSETNLGNLATDALRELTGAHIVLINGGTLRGSIPVGDITMADIHRVLPFNDNSVVMKEVSGQVLKDILEHGVSQYPEQLAAFPQLSGVTLVFDPNQAAGNRVIKVTVGSEPLQLDRKYLLATKDFTAAGGDGYHMLKSCPEVAEFMSLSAALVDYLQQHQTVAPACDGRTKQKV